MPDLQAIRERLAAYQQAAAILPVLYFDTTDPGERLRMFETAHRHYREDVAALLEELEKSDERP